KLYVGEGVFLEDLIGEGNLALTAGVTMMAALEHASEAQGMLVKLMMDAMEDLITETLHAGEADKQVLDKVNEIAAKAADLAESLQRKVTPEELAEEIGIDVDEIKYIARMSGFKIEDLDYAG
ncbi:MAG: hypothetical protein PHP50_14005, partial [Lachnospiraceae bacterium]|nr:hypothetical protein [Lachnospiraceae bacterium]